MHHSFKSLSWTAGLGEGLRVRPMSPDLINFPSSKAHSSYYPLLTDDHCVKELPEKDLIEGLREGDERIFKFIFDQYYRPLTVFALKYVPDVEEAKEIVQDFFVRLWSRHADLNIRFSLKMYLYQSVKNAALNYIEMNKVAQRRLGQYAAPLTSTDNALEHMMAAEQEEMLMRAIDALPEKCRQIFLLSRMQRLSNQAIATQLNISIKTVEGQISIALKRLAEWLITLLFFIS
jgi:RNA polymerase sigma-70 factor (ECF subfamily)